MPPKAERPLCGARCRSKGGAPCVARVAVVDGAVRARCRNHGGLSTGARTPEGRARCEAASRARWNRWRKARGLPHPPPRTPATPRQRPPSVASLARLLARVTRAGAHGVVGGTLADRAAVEALLAAGAIVLRHGGGEVVAAEHAAAWDLRDRREREAQGNRASLKMRHKANNAHREAARLAAKRAELGKGFYCEDSTWRNRAKGYGRASKGQDGPERDAYIGSAEHRRIRGW